MKRDIKEILGSADAEKISEDYKVVDRKTSRRMFSSYLKKVGTANNQFSETTENSEIYKFENTHILRRIAALAAYGAAFVLLIGATVGIIKMKGPKNNKLNPSPQPEILATESQTETDNNSSVNPTDKKDEKIGKEKTTSHSASSVTKTDKDNNSLNTDTALNESEANNSSEPQTTHKPDINDNQTTTHASENVEKPTSEYMDDNMTQIVKKQIELTDKLNNLNYIDACVEAEPEYYFTARDGKVYKLSLSLNFVQRNDANLQASLTPEITDIIKFFISQRAVLATPEQYNMLYGQGTVNETPTVTNVFNMLDSLNYQPISCDGLPTHKLTSPNGIVYYLHLDENASYSYVWRRPSLIADADNEAPLTKQVIDTIYANWDQLNIVEYHGI
jgi:cytoskeletal protein RodZ